MQKNREEFEEQPKKRRRRKKSRFGYYLYAVVMLFLTVANMLAATFLLTYVRQIEVSETRYVKESEIIEWFKSDPYTINSIYAVAKHKIAPPEIPAYLESAKVSWSAPWALSLDVQEKQIIGCILYEQNYIYFAKDGTVMMKGTNVLDGIPIIEGLHTEEVSLYETLKFDEKKIFSYVVNISEQIQENAQKPDQKDVLKPDRLVWEEESMNLYFGEICVCLGKSNFEEKLTELPPVLETLEGKKGKLHMEHFGEMSKNFSFVEEKDEPIVPETTPQTPETNENTQESSARETDSAEG